MVDQYTKIEEEVEKKQKVLQQMQTNFSNQLSESLAFQTANYLEGVYDVVGTEEGNGRGGRDAQARLRAARALDHVHGQDHRQVQVQGPLAGVHEARRGGSGRRSRRPWDGRRRARAVRRRYGRTRRRGGRGGGNPEVKKLAEEFQANVVA